jgi:hypothetical protein
VLVDRMRGRFTTWTRIRVNLEHVPSGLRPPQEALDPDDPSTRPARSGEADLNEPPRKPSRARKGS